LRLDVATQIGKETAMLFIVGTVAIIVLGYLFDKLEGHLKTIADAAVSIQSEMEAVRSGVDAISDDLTYLRNRLAPSPKPWERDDSS
jgi:hypothetical protein